MRNPFIPGFTCSILRLLIPFCVKAWDPHMEPFSYDWDGLIFEVGNTFIHFILVAVNFVFIFCGLLDF